MRRATRAALTVVVAFAVMAFTPSVVEPASVSAAAPLHPLPGATSAISSGLPTTPAPSGAVAAASGTGGFLTTTSARIEDRVVPARAVPVGLAISKLDISAPVIGVGGADDGTMEVPERIDEVAWYEFGAAPGETGSAVLAAHVDMAGLGPGVFFGLGSLEAGDVVRVTFDDATTASFEVVVSQTYLKEELDTSRIFSRTGPPTLTLVTCGGGFNPSLGRYDSNVVVSAVPIEARAAS